MENKTYHYPFIWDNGTVVKKKMPCPGFLVHPSWPTIRGSITMENGNGEPGEERHQVLANGDLTGDMN